MTRKEILKVIEETERKGEFDKHVDPIDYSKVITVDENYHYVRKGFEKLKYSLEELFIVRPFVEYINRVEVKTIVTGKENLKGVNSAVVTSNHVYMFDCLAIRYALKGHRLFTVGAPFNNMSGFLGEMMRAGKMLPLSESLGGMKKFNRAIDNCLKKDYVLFFPEQAMWWMYEKPRPLKSGAFKFAARNNVPVIPCFITYNETDKFIEDDIPKKQFIVNILPPIYPDKNLTTRQNIEYLKNENYNACKKKYEEFYKKPLKYSCDETET